MNQINILLRKEIDSLLVRYPSLTICKENILNAFHLLSNCFHNKGLIMVCGNGGSAADADHIVGELMKSFNVKRPISQEQRLLFKDSFPDDYEYFSENLQQAIPAISLASQTSLTTAFINDVQANLVYAQMVFGYGKSGDALIGLSTSGKSKNVVNACKVAKSLGIKTIAFTGEHESRLSEICDVTIRVPAQEVFQIQEYHLPVYHTLCSMLEIEAFTKNK